MTSVQRRRRDDSPFGGGIEQAVERERAPSLLEGTLESSELSACVQASLAARPDDHRIAIVLRAAEGAGNAEIARLLGRSPATAKIRVHRARTRLREALAAACGFEIDERGVLVCEPGPRTVEIRASVRTPDRL